MYDHNVNMLCKYRNMFGAPNTGIHAHRFMGLAVVDVIMTVVFAVFLSQMFQFHVLYAILGMFLLGVVMHRMFCVRTMVDQWFFPSDTLNPIKWSKIHTNWRIV